MKLVSLAVFRPFTRRCGGIRRTPAVLRVRSVHLYTRQPIIILTRTPVHDLLQQVTADCNHVFYFTSKDFLSSAVQKEAGQVQQRVRITSGEPECIQSPWCSGYHVCLTRTRSPVRSWVVTYFWFYFSHQGAWWSYVRATIRRNTQWTCRIFWRFRWHWSLSQRLWCSIWCKETKLNALTAIFWRHHSHNTTHIIIGLYCDDFYSFIAEWCIDNISRRFVPTHTHTTRERDLYFCLPKVIMEHML